MLRRFSQKIGIIGVNPHVIVPPKVLAALFKARGKGRRGVPVKGLLNGSPFLQTVVPYDGAWRLYLNGPMLKATGLAVGDTARIEVEYDPKPRTLPMHPKFGRALAANPRARTAFEALPAYCRKNVLRYLGNLKSEATVDRNVVILIGHLHGRKQKTLGPLFCR